MLERIVEDWLISAGERGYEAAFTQLLSSEGYRILQAPVHHPFEHGKDLIAIAPSGELHAFQLKGGDLGLNEIDRIQGQLFALANTAVRYPGVEPPRAPDGAFLVASGRLTPPARDRLAALNDAARQSGTTLITTIELDNLVGRFVRAHGDYLPRELKDLNQLLRLVLADGADVFPVSRFSEMLAGMMAPAEVSRPLDARRAFAAATILTSYAVGPWQREENHLGEAEGWLVLALAIMRVAEYLDLPDDDWVPSYVLARDTARRSLKLLTDEAALAEDLIIPDIVDGVVYPARASLVCGFAAAFALSELEYGTSIDQLRPIRELILREKDYMGAPGECTTPCIILAATALDVFGDLLESLVMVTRWTKELAQANAPDSDNAVPDPYHSMNEVLLRHVGVDSDLDEEEFAGEAYSLHIAIEWLARRGARALVEPLWPSVSRVHFCEFQTSRPAELLSNDDPDGMLHTWAPSTPQSWAKLLSSASTVEEAALPPRLWRHLELAPYLPLIYPQRLTADIAKVIDYFATERCEVHLIPELMEDDPTV